MKSQHSVGDSDANKEKRLKGTWSSFTKRSRMESSRGNRKKAGTQDREPEGV